MRLAPPIATCAVALVLLGPLGGDPCAQETCENIPYGGDEDVIGFIARPDRSCSVGNGTYVKKGIDYRLDAWAMASGECDWRGWNCSPLPCRCEVIERQRRLVYNVGVQEFNSGPSSPYSAGAIFPINEGGWIIRVPEMDSRIPGTTTPQDITWQFVFQGEATVKFKENIDTTFCNIQPDHRYYEIMARVVACIPQFLRDAQGNFIRLTPAGGPVYVYIPPDMNSRMRDAIGRAIASWNTALEGYPGTPRLEPRTTGGECSGPYCINTREDYVNLDEECARGNITPGTDGTIVLSRVTFPPESAGWSDSFTERLAAHELAHHLGLQENETSCPTHESLMRPSPCNASFGYPTSATVSDHMPVGKNVYGGAVFDSCPAS